MHVCLNFSNISIDGWVSTGDILLPRGPLSVSRDIFCLSHLEKVEARATAKYPTMHKIVPTTKTYFVEKVLVIASSIALVTSSLFFAYLIYQREWYIEVSHSV